MQGTNLAAKWDCRSSRLIYFFAVGVPKRIVIAAVLSAEGTVPAAVETARGTVAEPIEEGALAARVATGLGTATETVEEGTVVAATRGVVVGAPPPVSQALKSAAEASKANEERVRASLREEKIKVKGSFRVSLYGACPEMAFTEKCNIRNCFFASPGES